MAKLGQQRDGEGAHIGVDVGYGRQRVRDADRAKCVGARRKGVCGGGGRRRGGDGAGERVGMGQRVRGGDAQGGDQSVKTVCDG